MASYRSPQNRALANFTVSNRLNNQVVFSGTDEQILVAKGCFLLDFLQAESGGTVTIKDGAGNTMLTGVTTFNNDYVPLRCDYGIIIVGTVESAKGSVAEGVFDV